MSLGRHRRDWEDLATSDPLWAVSGKRRTTVEDFLGTGETEVDAVLRESDRLGLPARHERALDFGCGFGRITRELAKRFEWCDAVDISEGMLQRARELSREAPNCSFILNDQPGLELFPAEHFDFVYSSFVLQHMPSRSVAARYIRELLRVTRPDGLVVFQMPAHLPVRNRAQLRRRAYGLLRRLGVSRTALRRLRLHPVRMIALSRPEIESIVDDCGGSVIHTEPVDDSSPIAGYRYYVALTN
jgi:SAM-dependent methyltransferase